MNCGLPLTYLHSISPWQYFVTWSCVESFRSRSPNTSLRTNVWIRIATKMCSCKPSNENSQFRWSMKVEHLPRFQINFLASFYIILTRNPCIAWWRKKIRPLNRLFKVDSRAIDNRPFEYTRKLEQRMPKMIRVFAFPVSNSYYFKIIMDNIAPCTCNRFILVLYICIHSILS